MANDSTKLSFRGKRYLRKLDAASLAYRQSKESGVDNVQLKNEVQKMRTIYRAKYRPVLAENRGVTAERSVS